MTTILCIRKDNEVVMAGDGQATLGEAVIFKSTSVKVRRIGNGSIIAGFAGAAADGITLIERLEEKLEKSGQQLKRAAVALAKDWRMDKYLRQLQQRTAGTGTQLQLPEDIAAFLLKKCPGKDGARQIRRLVQMEVEGPLAAYLLRCARRPSRVRLRLESGEVAFSNGF